MSVAPIRMGRERGVALIIVLAFVVLLSGLAVAYFSRATTERQIASLSINRAKADALARSALEILIAELRHEIEEGSIQDALPATHPVFTPISNARLVPERVGTNDNLPNLVKRSVRNQSFHSAGGAASRASDISTLPSTTDIRRGDFALERWNAHVLLPRLNTGNSSDLTPVSAFTPPDWIFVNRAAENPKSWSDQFKNSDLANTNYVIGRYAYAIYDQGGLVNINVAGTPPIGPNTPNSSGPWYRSEFGRKGSPVFADIRTNGTAAARTNPASINPTSYNDAFQDNPAGTDQLSRIIGWRWYASIRPWVSYGGIIFGNYTFDQDAIDRFMAHVRTRSDGFLQVSAAPLFNGRTDQAFNNRQTLLAVRNVTDFRRDALPFYTTFSREVNSPSWGPTNPPGSTINYESQQNTAAVANRFLPRVRVTGTFTRVDGTQAEAGEALIKSRFALSRIAGIGRTGVNSTNHTTIFNGEPAAATAATIQRDFGLRWGVDLNGNGTIDAPEELKWTYVGHQNEFVQDRIKTLGEVANENREPNFFELLKAGILSGSLGKESATKTLSGNSAWQASADAQIIRIGACIIDQADEDNFPTTIAFGPNGRWAQHGIEDLPYLYSMLSGPRWTWSTAAWTPASILNYALIWAPQIWMPHAPTNVAQSNNDLLNPAQVRIRISNGTLESVTFPADYSALNLTEPRNLASNFPDGIQIKRDAYQNFRNEIRSPKTSLIAGTAIDAGTSEVSNPSQASLQSQINNPSSWWTSETSQSDCGFVLDLKGPLTGFISNPDTSNPYPTLNNNEVLIVMEYRNPEGGWLPYDSLAGISALPATGITETWDNGRLTTEQNKNTLNGMHIAVKWDPRTSRWGAAQGFEFGNPYVPPLAGSQGIRRFLPFNTGSPADHPILSGLWPRGNTGQNTAGTFTLIADRDGVFRPAMASVNAGVNPLGSTSNMGDMLRRPTILQRPFQSVGELSYVFRDTPWKQLDLFSNNSADAGLMDLFSPTEAPGIIAGKINLNTRQSAVLQTLISQASRRLDSTDEYVVTGGAGVATAATMANKIVTATNALPLLDVSGLSRINATILPEAAAIDQSIRSRRDVVARALAGSVQTRTWNFLIDVVAQSGRYPPNATGMGDFLMEGEQRYWLHIAIDRITGKIVDQQIELVAE